MKFSKRLIWGGVAGLFLAVRVVHGAGAGTEAASFLDIPVGGRPAAMGSAYSSLATDIYAPVINPAGLARLAQPQLGGHHLNYLESIHYEFVSFALPLKEHQGVAFSVQYLGSGDITGRDITGNQTSDYSSHYAAYTAAYGVGFGKLALGTSLKLIDAKLADVSARAFAVDAGALYSVTDKWNVSLVASNFGTPLKFIEQKDRLPQGIRLGTSVDFGSKWTLAAEGAYGLTSNDLDGRVGIEWRPVQFLALRTGYRTDTLEGLNALAGFSTGAGITFWNQEFAYAWVPYGPLGSTQYLSFVFRFGSKKEAIPANSKVPVYLSIEEIDHVSMLMD